jgi:hypothetical protein
MAPRRSLQKLRRLGVDTLPVYARGVSRWDYFPYVSGGKALSSRPFSVQFAVCWALAVPWLIIGSLSAHRWALALGVVWVILPLVSLARRGRTSG